MSEFDRLIDLQKQINSVRTQLNQLMTLERPQSSGSNGWLKITDGLWSYASATTITVPSGAASIYDVGDQVRLKQGGAYKYFYVITVADTLLTVTGGSNYSVADAAITDAAFSKGGGVGYPGWFNWTPTYSASGSMTYTNVTTSLAIFTISRRILILRLLFSGTTGGTASNFIKITAPVPISVTGYIGSLRINDAGYVGGYMESVDSSLIYCGKINTSNYGLGSTRQVFGNGHYII